MSKRKAETNKDKSNKAQHTTRGLSPALSNGYGVLEGNSDEDLDNNGFNKETTPEIGKSIRLLLRKCLISGSISPPSPPAAAEAASVLEGSPQPHQWSAPQHNPQWTNPLPLPPLPFMHPRRVRDRKRVAQERTKHFQKYQPLRMSGIRRDDH
jgi:hypothetical protein